MDRAERRKNSEIYKVSHCHKFNLGMFSFHHSWLVWSAGRDKLMFLVSSVGRLMSNWGFLFFFYHILNLGLLLAQSEGVTQLCGSGAWFLGIVFAVCYICKRQYCVYCVMNLGWYSSISAFGCISTSLIQHYYSR